MAAKKGSGDLNGPLRSLSETLRSLQRETGEMLAAARREHRAAKADVAAGSKRGVRAADNPLLRAVSTLLERWDVPTRDDLDAIRERLDRIEAALADRGHNEAALADRRNDAAIAKGLPARGKGDRRQRDAKPSRGASKNRRA